MISSGDLEGMPVDDRFFIVNCKIDFYFLNLILVLYFGQRFHRLRKISGTFRTQTNSFDFSAIFPKAYREPGRTSKIEPLVEIVNG